MVVYGNVEGGASLGRWAEWVREGLPGLEGGQRPQGRCGLWQSSTDSRWVGWGGGMAAGPRPVTEGPQGGGGLVRCLEHRGLSRFLFHSSWLCVRTDHREARAEQMALFLRACVVTQVEMTVVVGDFPMERY